MSHSHIFRLTSASSSAMFVALALTLCTRESLAEEPKKTGPTPAPPTTATPSAPTKATTAALLGVPSKPAPAADTPAKNWRVASFTPPAAPARPAPPKEPVAAPPKPAVAPTFTPKPASPSSCTGLAELRNELRIALNGEPHQLTAEQHEERDRLQAELEKETATQQALLNAVEKGIPRGPLNEAIDKSEKRVAELHEKIGAIKPAPSTGLAAVPARLDALTLSLQAIELKLGGSPADEPEGPPVADRPAEPEKSKAEEESKAVGLNLDAGLAGLYAFRGLNVFKAGSQMDQHALFAPGVTYNPTFIDGLTVGYWGAYQLTGDNAAALVKQGIGNEQDLTVSYGRDVIKEKLNVRGGVTNYVYPFAERAVAKTNTPYFFEPWGQLTYSGPVTASLLGTYFYGTEDAVRPFSYVYIHPAVEKTFTVNKTIGFVPGAGVGYKVFTHNPALSDNRYELTGDMKLPVASGAYSYATPALHYAWSNFSNGAVASAHAVWLSVNVGLNL